MTILIVSLVNLSIVLGFLGSLYLIFKKIKSTTKRVVSYLKQLVQVVESVKPVTKVIPPSPPKEVFIKPDVVEELIAFYNYHRLPSNGTVKIPSEFLYKIGFIPSYDPAVPIHFKNLKRRGYYAEFLRDQNTNKVDLMMQQIGT